MCLIFTSSEIKRCVENAARIHVTAVCRQQSVNLNAFIHFSEFRIGHSPPINPLGGCVAFTGVGLSKPNVNPYTAKRGYCRFQSVSLVA